MSSDKSSVRNAVVPVSAAVRDESSALDGASVESMALGE